MEDEKVPINALKGVKMGNWESVVSSRGQHVLLGMGCEG